MYLLTLYGVEYKLPNKDEVINYLMASINGDGVNAIKLIFNDGSILEYEGE